MTTEYIVICGQATGGGPFRIEYSTDGERFPNRARAITHGFTKGRLDDFNIGVLEDGKLVSIDWMEETVEEIPAYLAVVSEQLGLKP